MSEDVTFTSFVNPERWRTLDEHIEHMDQEMEQDIAHLSEQDALLRDQLRKLLLQEYEVKKPSEADREWARHALFSGDVCAIDGTRTIQPLLGGARCRVGVVAVSYRGNRTESVAFISEQQINPPEANPLAVLKRRRAERTVISSMVAGAIMAYMERQVALQRRETWRLLNGPLIPYELRTGLGDLRALDPCLRLAEAVIELRTIAGVSGSSVQPDVTSVGFGLDPGEYVCLNSLEADLTEYLAGSPDNGAGAKSAAKFSQADRQKFAQFIRDYGRGIDVGLMRAGARPYAFQAHHDVFDRVATLLIVDAEHQPLRSYPLLVDYADALCTRLLAGSDFRRQMEVKLAKGGAFEVEMPEQFFRRR